MSRPHPIVLLACATTLASVHGPVSAWAADAFETPIEATVTVDASQILRTMNPRMIGGSNIAMWCQASTFASPEIRGWTSDLKPGLLRLPGGTWANAVYWNGNGVRDAQGNVDPSKVGPDGYPAIDYSAYAPSIRVSSKTLHPENDGWHGNVDVKTLHEFVQAVGSEPMPCLNAGTGRPIDAAEWVKWANKKMGFNARYWEIGNELGGLWEPGTLLPFDKGRLTPEMYTKRYNDIARAMREMDPTIKIGGGAFPEEMLRDCGDNVNFVHIHAYPGSNTMTPEQLLAEIPQGIARDVGQVRGWIHKYQPEREKEIEIGYTEWNLGFSLSQSDLFSGLWSSVFLGEMARNGVAFANQWDCFTHYPPSGNGFALILDDNGKNSRKAEYYALWLWNHYMGDRLLQASSSDKLIYTYASRSDDAVYVMLVNGDQDREAHVNVQLSGFTPAQTGELVTMTSREYFWNGDIKRPQWSNGPRSEALKTGQTFTATIAPFSVTYLRIPSQDRAAAAANAAAQRAPEATPELRLLLPPDVYAGDRIEGHVMAVQAGTEQPYPDALSPADLSASGQATFDRSHARLAESLGRFMVQPQTPGEMTITADSGGVKVSRVMTVKPSVPRPVIFWDFTTPQVTDKGAFHSDFVLSEDLTQRANRAVARVDLPAGGVVTSDKTRQLLQVHRLPEPDKLKRENIRGVVFEVMTSPDFSCDDPDARIDVVMQGPADWWMVLGGVKLNDLKQWKSVQIDVTQEKHIKAMPSVGNLWFVLTNAKDKPAKGSVYFDHIGFMVR